MWTVRLALVLILIGVIGSVAVTSAIFWPQLTPPERRAERSRHLVQNLLQHELETFQRRLEELGKSLQPAAKERDSLEELRKSLTGIQLRVGQLELEEVQQSRLLDRTAQLATQSVASASGSVSFLSTLFVVVIFGVSLISGLHIRDLSRDLEKKKESIDQSFDNLSQGGVLLQARMATLQGSFTETNKDAQAYLSTVKDETNLLLEQVYRERALGIAFFDRLVNVHAGAFSEILGAIPLGIVFSKEVEVQIRLKGQELQGRLMLLHPSEESRVQGVQLLGAVGTKIAISELRRLQNDQTTSPRMALLIESAIGKIEKRLKEADSSSAPSSSAPIRLGGGYA